MMRTMLATRAQACSTMRAAPRPFTACRVAPAPRRLQQQRCDVRVAFFKFGKNGANAEDAGIVGAQGREDYSYDDVEQYFNYMGFLADEGTYDRMEAMLKGRHPIDVILLLAAEENDTPKIQEILNAGADTTVKGLDGRTPAEYASKDEAKALLLKGKVAA